jgi:hypothetical protein
LSKWRKLFECKILLPCSQKEETVMVSFRYFARRIGLELEINHLDHPMHARILKVVNSKSLLSALATFVGSMGDLVLPYSSCSAPADPFSEVSAGWGTGTSSSRVDLLSRW